MDFLSHKILMSKKKKGLSIKLLDVAEALNIDDENKCMTIETAFKMLWKYDEDGDQYCMEMMT